MICTFFGHRDTPVEINDVLQKVLLFLIEKKGVDHFLVGHNGTFDVMVQKALQNLKNIHPYIRYEVVLAYLPTEKNTDGLLGYANTIYPDGIENIPPRFAISARNRWMVEKAQFVVTYTVYSAGGAAQFSSLAKKKGKTVINLADILTTVDEE